MNANAPRPGLGRADLPASGDGWAAGPGGAPVWGRYGAAGLFLLADASLLANAVAPADPFARAGLRAPEVLLQHRATWTNNGDTWGIPGGARDRDETPEQAAVRETVEECAIDPAAVEILHSEVTAGPFGLNPGRPELAGNWTYTTVIARTRTGNRLSTTANEESHELRWVALDEVTKLPLLGAFRAAFPRIERLVAGLVRN